MLKSLEKLKDARVLGFGGNIPFVVSGDEMADEIQAEIDRYYLPRPLFEDGEPVQWGDLAIVDDNLGAVVEIDYQEEGFCRLVIGFEMDSCASHYAVVDGPRIKRYTPSDTQERIDADAEMGPKAYCEKYNLPVHTGPGTYPRQLQIADLLQRQRDLCARGDA